MTEFSLWLEFEEVDPGNWDIENDFANIQVHLKDGRLYGINVWTFKFAETAVKLDQNEGNNLDGLYFTPPDLFVKELSRDCIQKVISDLLKKGNLEEVLNASVLAKS
ncbi:MAG: hypothetical protein JO080_16835 [Mucilaginibacter sp.]|nr:hypothetical protein [Mucilaginibacter sp.]